MGLAGPPASVPVPGLLMTPGAGGCLEQEEGSSQPGKSTPSDWQGCGGAQVPGSFYPGLAVEMLHLLSGVGLSGPQRVGTAADPQQMPGPGAGVPRPQGEPKISQPAWTGGDWPPRGSPWASARLSRALQIPGSREWRP